MGSIDSTQRGEERVGEICTRNWSYLDFSILYTSRVFVF